MAYNSTTPMLVNPAATKLKVGNINPITNPAASYSAALLGVNPVQTKTSLAPTSSTVQRTATPTTPVSPVANQISMGGDFRGTAGGGYTVANVGPAGDTIYTKPGAPTPTGYNPVSSTENIRKEEIGVKNQANQLGGALTMANDYYNSVFGKLPYDDEKNKALNDELDAMRKKLGIFTSDEEAGFKAAGESAYQRYVPLIAEAQEAQRRGMPKAIISGGERGGFMNTQIAGAAALTPTEGGDFVGYGGELKNIEQIYDRNIQNLKVQAEQARFQAEQAAKEAARTGKQQDMKYAEDAYNRMVQANKDAISMANEKVAAISNFQTMSQARTTFGNTQQDRVLSQIVPAILPELTGDDTQDMALVQSYIEKYKDYGITEDMLIGALNSATPSGGEWKAVSPGSAIVDASGNIIGIAPQPADITKPETATFNGQVNQWNPATQSWIPLGTAGAGETEGASAYQVERATRTIESVDSLSGLVDQNPGILGRTAAVPMPESLRSDAYRNFKAQLNTLISNITFGELTAMREASKTGGALGQVSDTEGRLLGSSLGALSMTQSPEAFKQQLQKIKDSIQRWQSAVQQSGGSYQTTQTTPQTGSWEDYL